MAAKRLYLPVLAGILLAGCGWMSDDQRYYLRKDWEQLKDYDWRASAEQVTGFNEAFPSPLEREAKAEQRLCLHKNGSNRVISQNGVSDEVAYRQCVLRDVPTGQAGAGQRLVGRADGTPNRDF